MVKLRFSAMPDSTIRAREVLVLHSLRPRALDSSLQVNQPGGTTSATTVPAARASHQRAKSGSGVTIFADFL